MGCDKPQAKPPVSEFSINVCVREHCFSAEIADTPAKKRTGLMFRYSLGADKGMLFVFDEEKRVPFWMKNTYIPLDIIWIDAMGKIVDIKAAHPLDETSLPPKEPAQYVLELNAGTCQKFGIRLGDKVEFR